jgi:L-ectoine synthase
MIVRDLISAEQQGRKVVSPDGNWESTRMLLANDNMGFSFHITKINKGADFFMHYQNHLESVYCMLGSGEIEDIATGDVHPIAPGTLYILNKHDKHYLRAHEDMYMACVFNPPLKGSEVHNADGSYELDASALVTPCKEAKILT